MPFHVIVLKIIWKVQSKGICYESNTLNYMLMICVRVKVNGFLDII